jgi:hypothetical protein
MARWEMHPWAGVWLSLHGVSPQGKQARHGRCAVLHCLSVCQWKWVRWGSFLCVQEVMGRSVSSCMLIDYMMLPGGLGKSITRAEMP